MDKKELYKFLKKEFSKDIYKIRKQIFSLYANAELSHIKDMCELADSNLSNKSEKLLFIKKFKNNEEIMTRIINEDIPFNEETINYIFDTYNNNFLMDYFGAFLKIEGYYETGTENYDKLKVFLPYLKDNYNNFVNLTQWGDLRKVALFLVNEKQMNPEMIIKNLSNLSKFCKLEQIYDLETEDYKKLLTINDSEATKIVEIANSFKTDRTSVDDNLNIMNYLLKNPTIENINHISELYNNKNLNHGKKSLLVYNDSYEWAIDYLDSIMNSSSDLHQLKNSFNELIFGVYDRTETDKINKVSDLKEEELSNDTIEYLKAYKQLMNCNSKEDYSKFLEFIKETGKIYSISSIDKNIINNYHKDVNSRLLDPESLHPSENINIEYQNVITEIDGTQVEKKVKIIKLKGVPFECLTTSIGSKEHNKGAITEEQETFTKELVDNPELWVSKPKTGVNFICMSANSSDRFKSFHLNDMIVGGFSHVNNGQIKSTKDYDAGSNMEPGTTFNNTTDLIPMDQLTQYNPEMPFFKEQDHSFKIEGYNEVISDRENVIPDYFFTATIPKERDIPASLDKRTLKWAAYYDKPIVDIDCESYIKIGLDNLKKYIDFLKSSPQVPTMEELKKLEILKCKAENFSPTPIIDYYDLIMETIDMTNREWDLENIERLQTIFNNTFDKDSRCYEVATTLPKDVNPKEYKNSIEKDRVEKINSFKLNIKDSLIKLSNNDNTNKFEEEKDISDKLR